MTSVPDRLSPLDVSFLYFEEPTTPMHVGGVSIFQAPKRGFDHDRLVQLIARTSPGAKKGSTAPYAHAEFMLVETGNDQPRTLANAFRKAVDLRQPDVFDAAMRALGEHLANLDRAYGVHTQRMQLSVTPPALAGSEPLALAALCAALRQHVEQPAA